MLTRFGLGLADADDVLRQLGIFATAASRGKEAPRLARMLAGMEPRPSGLNEKLDLTWNALRDARATGVDELIDLAAPVWPRLATPGRRPWSQAARTFVALAHRVARDSAGESDRFVDALERRADRQRTETLLDQELPGSRPVQIMNFHQTKGREADVVVLVYRDSDYFGKERHPFPDASRLLYVSLTRASLRNVVILPHEPQPLVKPFASLFTAE